MPRKIKREFTKKEKRIITAIIAVIVIAVIAAVTVVGLYFGGVFDEKESPFLWTRDADKGYKKHYVTGGVYPGTYAIMTLNDGETDYALEFLLMDNYAPITVENFVTYANEGFYDGTVIHRIVTSTYTFQGGGYTYDAEGGYKTKKATHDAIRGEFASNPTGNYSYNKLSHFAGTISMARTTNKNSATSEFFISWENYPTWDGDYAAFGFLVDNADVQAVKNMALNAKLNSNGQPRKPITITKVEIKDLPEKDGGQE